MSVLSACAIKLRSNAKLSSIMQELDKDDKKQRARLVEEADVILKDMGMLVKQPLQPKMVGVHPMNRHQYGLSTSRAHNIINGFVENGFAFSAVHPKAFEEQPDKRCDKFTRSLTDGIDEMPTFFEGEIMAGSAGATHTNCGLCCIIDEVKSDNKTIAPTGRLDRANLESHDQNLAKALSQGMVWELYKSPVEEAFPKFPGHVQSALNITGIVQTDESQFEQLLNIQTRFAAMAKENPKVEWAKIVEIVAAGRTSGLEDINRISDFCKRWGGGIQGVFVHDLVSWSKIYLPSGRKISSEFWSHIANMTVPNDDKTGKPYMPAYVITAFIKTEASCPDKSAPNNISNYIRTGAIDALFRKNMQLVKNAEEILKEARTIVRELGLNGTVVLVPNEAVKLFGKLDCRMGRYLAEKTQAVKFKSVAEIGSAFITDLNEVAGTDVPNKWATAPAAAAPAAPTTHGRNFVDYTTDGSIESQGFDRCINNGYVPNITVKCPNQSYAVINSIDPSGDMTCTTCPLDGSNGSKFTVKFTDVSLYTITDKKVEHFNMDKVSWHLNATHGHMVIKACVSMCLQQLADLDDNTDINVLAKPYKAVIAKTAIKKGDITLVPHTSRIMIYNDESDVPGNGLRVEIAGYIIALLPEHRDTDFVVPCWCLREAPNAADINMELKVVQMVVNMPVEAKEIKKGKGIKPDTIKVGIPVYTNCKKIDKMQELMHPKKEVPKVDNKRRLLQLMHEKRDREPPSEKRVRN
jgi:hypothetical protein